MPDKLQQAYEAWKKTVEDPVEFQSFQGGFTAGAVSMRERAMAEVQPGDIGLASNERLNEIKNAIGALPDVAPE